MDFLFKSITILIIVLVITYGFFISESFRKGPIIEIDTPQTNTEVETPVTIRGSILNASFASINDRPINVKIDGQFTEVIPLPVGYNIIKIYARDDKNKEEIVYLELLSKQIE